MEERRLWLVLGALLTGLFLSALDSTIVSTALPTIVGDLGGLNHISWVFTAYLLSSTVSVPLLGKVGDIYGRKVIFQIIIVIFLLGSVLAGLSQNLVQLIVFRGIQGIGGGGLLAMAFTILGDILAPRERGKYMGYFTGVFAAASVIGPLVGGFFVDHLSWRWVFYVNLPIGAVALVVTARYLEIAPPTHRRRIDIAGAGLFTAGVSCLLLASTWGGQQYPWASPMIIGLLGGGLVLGFLFVAQERRATDPLIPLRLFHDAIFVVSISMAMLLGAVMVGGSVFLPLFLQVVLRVSATSSGLLLVPMMAGVLLGSICTGRIVTRTGRYRLWPIIGTAMTLAGIGVLALLTQHASRTFVSTGMAVLGLGIGTASPILTLAVQNNAPAADMGVSTSAVNFFRSLGSAVGVAILGSVMNARLTSVLADRLPRDVTLNNGVLRSPAAIRALPGPVYDAVAAAISQGVAQVFRVGLLFVAGAFALSWFLREIPLREDVHVSTAMIDGAEEAVAPIHPADSPPIDGVRRRDCVEEIGAVRSD